MTFDTIWLVTTGEYSDFRVLAAYNDEASAQAAVHAGFGENVQACALVPAGYVPKRRVLYHASQRVVTDQDHADQHNLGSHSRDLSVATFEEWETAAPADNADRLNVRYDTAFGCWHLNCFSYDRERAIKIVSDKASAIRAEAEGL